MSISALNAHLARLEKMRLIHRVRSHDPRTYKRQAARYILGFEDGFPQEPTPKTGDGFAGTEKEHDDDPAPDSAHGAISGKSAIPSPDFAQSHLRNPETNLVREPLSKPVSKPVKEEEEDGIAASQGLLIGGLFGIATSSALQGDDVEIAVTGVFDMAKASATVIAQGDQAAWDDTAKEIVLPGVGLFPVGIATTAAGNGATTVSIRLDGVATAAA